MTNQMIPSDLVLNEIRAFLGQNGKLADLLLGRGSLRELTEDETVPLTYAIAVYWGYFGSHGIGSIADVLLERATRETPQENSTVQEGEA